METFTKGNVVLISFPFSDLSASKLRPAIVLASASKDDWILCQVTSKSYSDKHAIQIEDSDFIEGGLQVVSYVRPTKIFTAHKSLIQRQVGTLSEEKSSQIINRLIFILSEKEDI